MTLLLVAAFVLALLASALFSGVETGVYALNKHRLELRAEKGSSTDRSIRALLADASGFITLFMVGNALVNDLATVACHSLLHLWHLDDSAEILTVLLVTPVLFVLGEAMPKSWCHLHAETVVRRAWPLVRFARGFLLPLILLVRPIARHLSRMMTSQLEQGMAETRGREVLTLLLGEGTAPISHDQRAIVANVARLATRSVRVAMVPMARVECLTADLTVAQALDRVAASVHGRFPVVAAVGGGVHGAVSLLDLLYDGAPERRVGDFAQPLVQLSEGLRIEDALARLATASARMGLVVSPSGRPLGIVTHKDLVEEIVGELRGM